ncbi:MAG: toxin-antitoxin system HicB family antitoxin [Micropruina sp.]|uniref:toxin-antitoxin system HicB family antitoxin n=1 Tax=Micropruina sp. TaxID=2737536 RepID=UPI0039E21F05
MDLNPYLGAVAADLEKATALADDATRELTARVAVAVEPALRLAMTQLLADAAAQLTSELGTAVITVRMDGREPVLDVQEQAAPAPAPTAPAPAGSDGPAEDDGVARVTVRLPEQLKRRAEGLAQSADQSLNTWIVQAVRRAAQAPHTDHRNSSRRVTGWA